MATCSLFAQNSRKNVVYKKKKERNASFPKKSTTFAPEFETAGPNPPRSNLSTHGAERPTPLRGQEGTQRPDSYYSLYY